eukprot:CAMPEP_0185703526 /NCGR_PEP_ID=MMETSP1164-20130828/14787_1 /TAXON_ID=1104430 /ORGANISM="Chrysoreinhardia sp, Strain CCMP2950" /LENGTH=195 /DNA_ID=CAMNT_0028370815 /DNA_START=72 /DNA_END=659 /DNA_ORIENTATION=+
MFTLDNRQGEFNVHAMFEMYLRAAWRTVRANVYRVVCENKQAPSSSGMRFDILLVLDDVAVLMELKCVRPNAVCNSENKNIIDLNKFTQNVRWAPNLLGDFEDCIATRSVEDLKNLTVDFKYGLPNDLLPYRGTRKRQVRDYFIECDQQLDKYKQTTAEYVKALGAKRLYLFGVVNIGRRVIVQEKADSPIELTL